MLEFIQEYLDGETDDFCSVVGKLEGALDAAEIKDKAIINEWYEKWIPLETRRAVKGNDVKKGDAMDELSAMKTFLLSKIKHAKIT
jgi:hypothetical protein